MAKYLGLVNSFKPANGYHYKNLYVINHGPILSAITNGGRERRDNYFLVKTHWEFTVKLNTANYFFRGLPWDSHSLSELCLLQLSTNDGEVFYTVVKRKRILEIQLKARAFLEPI